MQVSTSELASRQAYKLLVSAVVPRPIGWVSTRGADGRANLAPFSFFNAVCASPPTVVLGIGNKKSGEPKDTATNILDTGEFVVNLVSRDLAEAMNASSARVEASVDEFELADLEPAPATTVKAPRVAASPVSLECRFSGKADLEIDYHVLFGEVQHLHVRDDVLGEDGLVDAAKLQPVARLGGRWYGALGELFTMERPTATAAKGD